MALYLFANGARTGGATPFASVTTGSTAAKTMLQLKSNETGTNVGLSSLKIKEWGISFDGYAAAQPIKVELLCSPAYSTVTAATNADIIKFDNYYAPDAPLTFGTTATGYTSSSENAGDYAQLFDLQLIAPTNQYVKQFPLGLEPSWPRDWYVKIRVTASAAVNAYCYILFET